VPCIATCRVLFLFFSPACALSLSPFLLRERALSHSRARARLPFCSRCLSFFVSFSLFWSVVSLRADCSVFFSLTHTHTHTRSLALARALSLALSLACALPLSLLSASTRVLSLFLSRSLSALSFFFLHTLQHNATYCNTLQHTATHCNTLQHTATYCNTCIQRCTSRIT